MKYSRMAGQAVSLAVLISIHLPATGAQALGLNDLNMNLNNAVPNSSRPLLSAPPSLGNLHKLSTLANQTPQIPKTQSLPLNNGPLPAQGRLPQQQALNPGSPQIQFTGTDTLHAETGNSLGGPLGNGRIVNHSNLVTVSGVTVQPGGRVVLVGATANEASNLQTNASRFAIHANTGLANTGLGIHGQGKVMSAAPQPAFPLRTAQAAAENGLPDHQPGQALEKSTSSLAQNQQDKAVDAIHASAFAVNRQTAPWGVNIVTTHNKLQKTTGITPNAIPAVK